MNLQMLNKFKKNYFSQNGEDEVIEEICRRLQITGEWFCEFGDWAGKYLNICTLSERIERTPIPKEFDLLSIDIVGQNYHVWKGLKSYQPKIV